jgi:chorismate synthase
VPEDQDFDLDFADLNALRVPHREYAELIAAKLAEVRKAGDSAGGIVGCRISGLPAGLGEPVFDKLSAVLAHAVLSIGGTKGMEFGAGFSSASSQGSLLNDCPSELVGWLANGVPLLSFSTNNAGGMLGGLSTGQPVEFRVAFKPVPSIAQAQQTLDNKGQPQTLSIEGRHDVCIVPRAVAVVEAMSALALADLFSLKENLGGVNGKTKIRSNLF